LLPREGSGLLIRPELDGSKRLRARSIGWWNLIFDRDSSASKRREYLRVAKSRGAPQTNPRVPQ